ncbi:MAG: efflux RND transporter periplasmic adaptor subunit [Desulfarculaceae bacterium]|nr:efflux RND transporter periplasmic adaptor subunit [Desulfarculaceae bacterium]MCF8072128.1 efflux RND transporter periplasmic adaptor subunit [Desulfarculaceae bacterium]MCF8100049.1 efflux RND transporter periplasmic adaptor subunit [Desulfarculaceae bacterium]MCF8118152.1 efflux RND transporter periplasmic adaptor subunit [Desulfarculaceae bacterium]
MPQMLSLPTRVIVLAAAVVCLLAAAACNGDKEKFKEPPPAIVTVAEPVVKTVTDHDVFTGNTQAVYSVDIMARVEGQLRSVDFEVGSRVDKDQLLFIIEPEPYKAKVDIALADLAVAVAKYKLAQATLVRKENAYKDRAVSEVEVIQAKAESAEAAAQIEAAKAQVERDKIDYGYTHVHAPIAGRISRNLVDVGNLVGAGQTTKLTSVVMDDPIYAYFTVSERIMLEFRDSQRQKEVPLDDKGRPMAALSLANEEDFPHKGYLDWIDNKVDPNTGTIQVRGVFPNPDQSLMPGLFVRIQVPTGTIKDALLVPEAALSRDQRGYFIYTVDKNNIVHYSPVDLGPLQKGMQVILKGVKAGDRVVIKGLQRVRAGSKCTPLTEQEAKQMAAQQEAAMKAKMQGEAAGDKKEEAKAKDKAKDSEASKAK